MYIPVNLRNRDAQHEKVLDDVRAALRTADFYMACIPGGADALRGRCVLEIGAGYSLGAAMVLACYGAQLSVTDPYPPEWDPQYHRLFYSLLLKELALRSECDLAPLQKLIDSDCFDQVVVNRLACGIEALTDHACESFDYVFSCAVLEHVIDIPRACQVLGDITKPEGIHVHQVDFRDHRDFDRPLEFLTIPEDDFLQEFDARCGECGNRWRPFAMQKAFQDVNFRVLQFSPNQFADDGYISDVLPRLDRAYKNIERDELRIVSGYFVLMK